MGIDGLCFFHDFIAEIRAELARCAKVDSPSENGGKLFLNIHKSESGNMTGQKLNENIQVAVRSPARRASPFGGGSRNPKLHYFTSYHFSSAASSWF